MPLQLLAGTHELILECSSLSTRSVKLCAHGLGRLFCCSHLARQLCNACRGILPFLFGLCRVFFKFCERLDTAKRFQITLQSLDFCTALGAYFQLPLYAMLLAGHSVPR